MGLSTTKRVTWRGVTVDQRTAAMLAELAAISGDITITPIQGSFRPHTSYSGGTHTGAGAVDVSIRFLPSADRDKVVKLARSIGFAAWHRQAIAGLWVEHCHMIAVPPAGRKRNNGNLSTSAFAQVVDYYNNMNGLAGSYRAKDNGPRGYVGTTWESYTAAKQAAAKAKEADVASVTDTAKKTWQIDGLLPSGSTEKDKSNKFWAPGTYLRQIFERVVDAKATINRSYALLKSIDSRLAAVEKKIGA